MKKQFNFLISLSLFVFLSLSCNKNNEKYSSVDTTKEKSTPSGPIIMVDIQNGTGDNRIAVIFRDYLKQKGFDVVNMGNYKTSDVDMTQVIDKAGDMNKARSVAETLGISGRNVYQQINKSEFLDVSIVIGMDFNEMKPFTENKINIPLNKIKNNNKNSDVLDNNKVVIKSDNYISADVLLSDFSDNQIRANNKYQNKKITVKGTIYKISKSPTNYSVIEIKASKYSTTTLQCALLHSEDKKALLLSKGDEIIITGKCSGKLDNYSYGDIYMLDCKIK
jgi:hypothetical protein